jgi:hypothetical protein
VRQIEQFGLLAKTGFPDSKAHFSVLALQDFCLQRRVGLDPLAEGGKFDRLWHQPCQQHRRRNRRCCSHGLDYARQPVIPVPQIPHLHQVRHRLNIDVLAGKMRRLGRRGLPALTRAKFQKGRNREKGLISERKAPP